MPTTFLFTEDGAAAALRITPRQVRRLVDQRRIPFIELPDGQVRFDPDELAEWCRTLRRPAGVAPCTRPAGEFETR
jgi:excisionase family DNA binding protein